jgi:hypothetical protein
MIDTESGHTLESSYWTGDQYDIEKELDNLDNEKKRWQFKDLDYETLADEVKRLYEG